MGGRTIVTSTVLLLFLLGLGGCGGDAESAKRSHFEHDHDVAEHWPRDLADTATKIRQRIDRLDSDSDAVHLSEQIVDLVSWAPEIAADTDLPEERWLPIHHASESLTANLRSAGNRITPSNREQAIRLCELIDQSVLEIPDHFAMNRGRSE
jgi:hypothetical protein